ncbi:hypothetical protein FRC03_006362 [Tulasnella sp. 419]|nr:hypothetical protein FRC03_006362 [Tulasnella sp. 419]
MESPHTNIPEGSNSTASSPPDPSTPPQDIFSSHPDVVQDRDSTYHHQQHSNITPIQHHPSLPPSAQSTPPKQQIQLPSLHSPSSPSFPFDSHHPSSSYHLGAHSSLPMPLLDRPPPLERATPTEADGFWPVQPSGPLTAPAGTLRRASFLDDLYEPQVNSASHQGSTQSTPVSGSPHPQSVGASFQQPHQAREPLVSLPRINRLSSFNPEWPPNSSASPAFSSSPSPPHISHHAHSNSLPVTSASLSSSPSTTNPFVSPMVSSSSSSYSSYPPPLHSSEPPFLRRASFPIAQREENHSIPPLSSSTSYYNIPPPAQPPQSHRDYSSTIAPPTYPGQQQSQSNYRPVLANSANQGYTAEPMPISASPSVLSHQANVGHGAGPQRHHSYSQQGHNHHHPYASSTSRFMHRSHSTHSIPTVNQDANSWPSRPVHPSAMAAAPAVPAPAPVIMHTDDAASKETAHLRRTCYNCRTTDPPSWRRSTLTPGKIVSL